MNKWVNLHLNKPKNKDKIKGHKWIKIIKEKRKMNREKLFKKIVSILARYRVKKIAVFGSYARGEAKPESDVDILVEFSERKSFWRGYRCGLGHSRKRHSTFEERNQKSH